VRSVLPLDTTIMSFREKPSSLCPLSERRELRMFLSSL